jgi:hypothetical protein
MLFCNDEINQIKSIYSHIATLIGGLGVHGSSEAFQPAVPEYMAEANRKFLKKYVNYDMVERPQKSWRHNTTVIDKDLI